MSLAGNRIGSASDRSRRAFYGKSHIAVRNNDPAEAGGIDTANDPERLINATAEDEGTARTDDDITLNIGGNRRRRRQGSDRVREGRKVERQDIAPSARSLGRLKNCAHISADQDLRSVGQVDVPTHVQQVEVAADLDAG